MTFPEYDLFVIGGGSGGVACARRAASHGAKVAIAEGERWGGTCVNVGCVPKKIMWWASSVHEILKECHHYGFSLAEPPKFDWKYLKARRDESIKRLNSIYQRNLHSSGITQYPNYARFTGLTRNSGHHVLEVGKEGNTIAAKRVVIAVGGCPSTLGVPGEELTINSDGFFELEDLPKKVAVIGAGYIAVELAGVLNGLGSETHLFCRGEYVLRKFDHMLSREVTRAFVEHGGILHPNTNIRSFLRNDEGTIDVELETKETFCGFDCVLVATGRNPLVESLELKKAGIEQSRTAHIVVDEFQATSLPNVFALGDVCGKVELTPMAIAAGRRLADRLFLEGFGKAKADYEMVPTVVFSHPPIGTIGLTEHEARELHGESSIIIYEDFSINLYYNVFDLAPSEKPKSRFKLICLKGGEEKIVGLHMIGMGCDEILQGFAIAIKMGASKQDFDSCVAIHPSAAEELVTLAPWGLGHPGNEQKTMKKN